MGRASHDCVFISEESLHGSMPVRADCADCQQGERKMEAAGHFWDVASIQWPGVEGEDQITVRDRYYTQAP